MTATDTVSRWPCPHRAPFMLLLQFKPTLQLLPPFGGFSVEAAFVLLLGFREAGLSLLHTKALRRGAQGPVCFHSLPPLAQFLCPVGLALWKPDLHLLPPCSQNPSILLSGTLSQSYFIFSPQFLSRTFCSTLLIDPQQAGLSVSPLPAAPRFLLFVYQTPRRCFAAPPQTSLPGKDLAVFQTSSLPPGLREPVRSATAQSFPAASRSIPVTEAGRIDQRRISICH